MGSVLGLLWLLLLLLGWVAVQRAWRRSFADTCSDPDALAGRLGCRRDCGTRACPARGGAGEEEER